MPEPATVWWVGRACRSPRPCGLVVMRLGPSVTTWWCFWHSDVPGHSIASGVWGSEGCGQQLAGGVGPSEVYTGVYGHRGRGWFTSLVVYAGHMTAEGPGGCASWSSRLLGIAVAVYTSQNSWPPVGSGPVVACMGTHGHQEGLWLVAGSQNRGPAIAEVWVGVGLADFSGSRPCLRGFEEGSSCTDAKDMTREKLSFSVARAQQEKKELDLS